MSIRHCILKFLNDFKYVPTGRGDNFMTRCCGKVPKKEILLISSH
jgi:hypothetical protein